MIVNTAISPRLCTLLQLCKWNDSICNVGGAILGWPSKFIAEILSGSYMGMIFYRTAPCLTWLRTCIPSFPCFCIKDTYVCACMKTFFSRNTKFVLFISELNTEHLWLAETSQSAAALQPNLAKSHPYCEHCQLSLCRWCRKTATRQHLSYKILANPCRK
jgi:hypothetical protein